MDEGLAAPAASRLAVPGTTGSAVSGAGLSAAGRIRIRPPRVCADRLRVTSQPMRAGEVTAMSSRQVW